MNEKIMTDTQLLLKAQVLLEQFVCAVRPSRKLTTDGENWLREFNRASAAKRQDQQQLNLWNGHEK